jgi:hypothetical protein
MCGFDWNFSFVGLTTENFTVGQAAFKAASSKVVKHERACSDNQHVFIALHLTLLIF